jgi:hypothetical protein
MAELTEALRDSADVIALEWDAAVREAMPNLPWNTTDRPQNHTPRSILVAIADSLESGDSRQMQRVIWESRIHGLARSRMNFEIRDVMLEDRLVRAIVVKCVEALLDRHLEASEFRTLSAAIDVMLQHAIFTVVDQQKAQLRKANETEHKHLAYLSHDLNNNLSNITLSLTHLRLEMENQCARNKEALIRAEQLIVNTVGGMKRLLEYERLRNSATLRTRSGREGAGTYRRSCPRHCRLERATAAERDPAKLCRQCPQVFDVGDGANRRRRAPGGPGAGPGAVGRR